jgi:hypothetical protein
MQSVDDEFDHGRQKSKLIIFLITMTPMLIQQTQPNSMTRPMGWVQSSEM